MQQTFEVHKNTSTRLADRGKGVPLIPLRAPVPVTHYTTRYIDPFAYKSQRPWK